jgi:predicted deacylase
MSSLRELPPPFELVVSFVRAVESLPLKYRLERFEHPTVDLPTHMAWIGSPDASKVIVIVSGIHGVEGHLGHELQMETLHQLQAGQRPWPDHVALMLIHLINPWGFVHHRRCDEAGVDLNRNFIDFSKSPHNEKYSALQSMIFHHDLEEGFQQQENWKTKQSERVWEHALTGGQYSDPKGPFYGGTCPSRGRMIIEDLMARYQLKDRDLMVLDLHSGLGEYGLCEAICDHEPNSSQASLAKQVLGHRLALPALGEGASVPKWGLHDYAWHRIMNERSFFVTLEFGTYSTHDLIMTLVRDHRLYQKDHPEEGELFQQHQDMLNHFYPNDSKWLQSCREEYQTCLNLCLERWTHA